jgi:hypothetical protein
MLPTLRPTLNDYFGAPRAVTSLASNSTLNMTATTSVVALLELSCPPAVVLEGLRCDVSHDFARLLGQIDAGRSIRHHCS